MFAKADINLWSAFDRKNYFYPDLPQGYQISQLYHPIVGEGEVLVELGDGTARNVRVERIHMEQDAGKSIHDMDPNMSFVDLNRTGVCLMEIVSRPDIRGPEEAAAYIAKLRQIMRYLGTKTAITKVMLPNVSAIANVLSNTRMAWLWILLLSKIR